MFVVNGNEFEQIFFRLFQMDGRTIGGKIYESGGGVARNIADALGKLPNINPFLITAIGKDNAGYFIKTNTISHLVSQINNDLSIPFFFFVAHVRISHSRVKKESLTSQTSPPESVWRSAITPGNVYFWSAI